MHRATRPRRPLWSAIALFPDAHLAALAVEHGLLLVSMDGDFARFPGLRFEDPLAEPADG